MNGRGNGRSEGSMNGRVRVLQGGCDMHREGHDRCLISGSRCGIQKFLSQPA